MKQASSKVLWLVSIFENTPIDDNKNTRYNSIANVAIANGYKVTFWANTFRHNTKVQRFDKTTRIENTSSLETVFVKSGSYKKNISLQRLITHYQFSKKILKEFDKEINKPDLLLFAFPPISLGYEISKWAKANNIACFVDIIDPWPDVFQRQLKYFPAFLQTILLYPLRRKVRIMLGNVSAITAISNQYIEMARGYYKSIKDINCYYPAVNIKEIQLALGTAAKVISRSKTPFTIIYAGSLGYSYDIPTILKVAEMFENKHGDKINFIIAGDGPYKSLIKEYIKTHSNLTYLGRIGKENLMEEYYQADIGLTQHISGATQSVTYKLFDLLGSGLPILNSLKSEMREIIEKEEVGLFNEPNDHQKLAENIEYYFNNPDKLEETKKKAIQYAETNGDAKIVYGKLLSKMEGFNISFDA